MNIPNEFRPVPFYFINTVNREELSRDAAADTMKQLKDARYGGCIFFNNPPMGFSRQEYFSDFWFEVMENFILAARDTGLAFWINDGYDYPPGDVAGQIRKRNPKLVQHRLTRMPDGEINVVEVPWGFPAFEEPETSRLFIELCYEEYYKRLGKYFGNGITGFFSDADNRRVNSGNLRSLNGESYYPWSSGFASEFQKMFGYDIEPRLSELFDGKNSVLNHDYWSLANELYQRWFRNNYEWCKQHGIKYSFHTSDTGPFRREECPRSSLFLEGVGLKLLAYSDYPGTDHEIAALDGGTHYDQRLIWTENVIGTRQEHVKRSPMFNTTKFDLRAKYASSASFLYGKERTLCEAFAATNWIADPALLRRIAAWQIMQGINFFVPHAVHHRFFGPTKYFAPPEFLHGSLRHGIKELNDFLARFSFIASQGEYVAPIGVLDPSPEIIAGTPEKNSVFELCDRLNRQSLGYVITDAEHASHFEILLNPLSEIQPELPEPDASFDGGELAWMKRRLADGTEYLLVANLWSDNTLSGHLTFGSRTLELELEAGEIAVIGGPYETFRLPRRHLKTVSLPMSCPPKRMEENIIPLHTLREWECASDLAGLSLLVPEDLADKVSYDGVPLNDGIVCKVFDDKYLRFNISGSAGHHHLKSDVQPSFETPFLLCGNFSIHVDVQGRKEKPLYTYYLLRIMEPETMRATLYPAEELKTGDWTEQGLLFYSGGVEYEFNVNGTYHSAVLELNTDCICEVLLDHIPQGRLIWPPYTLNLGDLSGEHRIAVRVWNSFANRFDGIVASGGLYADALLHFES